MDGALTTYRKAFAIREALAEADPKNVNAQGALARAYLRIGEILQKKPAPAAALVSYRKALAIDEVLSKSDPSNEVTREAVAVALDHQARAETVLASAPTTPPASRAGHTREARSTYRKSLDLWLDLRNRGVLRGTNSGEPARVAEQIALCDEALKKK